MLTSDCCTFVCLFSLVHAFSGILYLISTFFVLMVFVRAFSLCVLEAGHIIASYIKSF